MKTWLLFPVRLGLYCAVVCLPLVGCGGAGSSQNNSSTPVTPLAIQSVTPSSVPVGSSALTVTISGTGFTPSSLVTVNNTQVSTVYVSATQLQATVPAGQLASGAQLQVGVTNGAGSTTSTTVTLEVDNPAPVLLSLTPSTIVAGTSGANVMLTGSGFISTSTASVNGSARTTTFTSATQITVSLTASDLASVGNSTITVANSAPGGGTSAGQSLGVVNPLPTITSISPGSIPAGSASTTLDIVGTNFLPTSTVLWNNSTLTSTFVSATEVKASIPAASLTTGAAVSIGVSNPAPGGGVSAPFSLQVVNPTPVLTSILPSNVATGSSATVTLTGSGFVANSVVEWNGSARPTTFLTATSLQVALSATDLMNNGTGKLTVMNPSPGGGLTSASTLNITSFPIPTIQGVTLSAQTAPGCSTIQATITGTNLASGDTVQLNGSSFRSNLVFVPSLNSYGLLVTLPAGAIPQSGPLTFTVTNNFLPAVVSDPYTLPSTAPPIVVLCSSPSPANVYPNSSFSIFLTASEINSTDTPTVSLGGLPTGIALTSPASISVPKSGTTLSFTASSTAAAGTYSIPVTGQAGSLSVSGSLQLVVQAGSAPSFSFTRSGSTELGVAIGGSNQIQFGVTASGNADYNIVPTVSGLPAGTTASVSPSTVIPGQSVTVAVTASSTAPVSQNVSVTLTGTPAAAVPSSQISFLLDVTQPPGSLPGSRTDFVSTAGTPYAVAYDASHNLIFSSNPSWNRIDVISNLTHKIVKSIPVRSPRGLDITQDNSLVWVQTASQNLYSINTASLQARQYSLPNHSYGSSGLPVQFATDRILALNDGTLFVFFDDTGSGGSGYPAIWNPQTNQLNVITTGPISAWSIPVRSGDGSHVYASNNAPYGSGVEVYDTSSKTLSTIGSGTSYGQVAAVNTDGSKLILSVGNNYGLYDQNLNSLGTVPGSSLGFGVGFPLDGGIIYSPDSTTLYEIGALNNLGVVLTIDPSSLKVLGEAPSASTDPVGTSGYAGTATPFAIDANGIVLGMQNYGISFDDSTFYQNYATNQPGINGSTEYIATYAGPLAGGTQSSLYVFPPLTPDVWFGQTRGSVSSSPGGELSFTSPPSATRGPVNVKFNLPDGTQMFYPQLFSYSTYPEYAITSGSSPNGGAAAQVLGYGFPQDASGGTLTVGGTAGTITTTAGQYPPLSGEPFPSTILAYTFPQGTPGWADLQITTTIGTGTLPKSVFYAKSVTDYSSSDSFTSVLLDEKRNQIYLSAGDHIDVFSTTSNQFVAQLQPAAVGAQKQFTGLALTPDGSQLLVADLLDGSLAVIDPDAPSNTFAIPIAAVTGVGTSCANGPLYVAATSANQAFVTTGGLPATSCSSSGITYIANLQTHTVSRPSTSQCGIGYLNPPNTDGYSVDASGDGNFVAIGITTSGSACVYSVQNSSYTMERFTSSLGYGYGVAISSDANVVGSNQVLGDVSGNLLGSLARPIALYGNSAYVTPSQYPLQRPRLNASGSLYYFAYPNSFEIIDVPHATLRMRFALTETVQNTASPLAIDSGGRYVYLATDKGLTVVDLGEAPLSIGHLSAQTASPGSQITLRGSGFDAGTTATVGGVAAVVSFTDENTLTVTVPAAASGPQDIVLTRSDGESYTLENGVVLP